MDGSHSLLFRSDSSLALRCRKGAIHPIIQYLADQFEACGGKARAYVSNHSREGYAKTPFRQFVHQFYAFLSLKSRRTSRGLDEAIRQVLMNRRRRPSV